MTPGTWDETAARKALGSGYGLYTRLAKLWRAQRDLEWHHVWRAAQDLRDEGHALRDRYIIARAHKLRADEAEIWKRRERQERRRREAR